MNDCTNAEIRDQLPDLLHDRLTVSVRELVVAHVADCADCREELDVLRGVRSALLARTPRVNVGQIVASLPKPSGAPGVVVPIAAARERRRMRVDWRVAAAVTFLAVGGSSIALLQRAPSADQIIADSNAVATMPSAVVAGSGTSTSAVQSTAASTTSTATPNAAPVARRVAADSVSVPASSELASTDAPDAVDEQAAADVSPGGRFAGLSNAQLKALLDGIGQLPDVPVTEPAPVSIEVNTAGGAGGM